MSPGFLGSSVGKESTCNVGDLSLIPGLERSPGEEIGYPLQYSWVSLVAQLVKNPPTVWETWVRSLGWKRPWRRERLPPPVFWPGEFSGLYSPIVHGVTKSQTRLNDFCIKGKRGTSLTVQWLRLCASSARAGLIPGQGTKIPYGMQCSQENLRKGKRVSTNFKR